MIYGMHLSTAGMMVNQYRQDLMANNIANIDTVGFKHDLAVLTERPVESREDADAAQFSHRLYDRLTGGTLAAATRHAFVDGPTIQTGNLLDARIEGPGFFEIATPDGPRYTRDGRFVLDVDGVLVTAVDGHAVMDDAGNGIRSAGDDPVTLDSRGGVRQGGRIIARLAVVEFEDPDVLRKVGANLFVASGDRRGQRSAPRLAPGTLEGSTVDPINGLAEMIRISRGFELNANYLRLQDQTLGRLISDVARF